MALLLDEHIDGKYEILEKLREGGMGAIYKVRHRLLDEIRVVKVIRSAVAHHPDAGERFLREARAAIRLRHPNIAALHDFAIAQDGNAYIIMEFINGSTLQEILDRHGPPPLALTLEIARQSLRALGYLHRQKIVHRDVSPDNLMLTQDVDGHPFVKLIDLGIAKAFEESAAGLTSTGVFLGKPRYASPEQFSSQGVDARSDLYSFGVVLYELLTGRCPILGSDAASYLAGHLLWPPIDFGESDPKGRVPPALREIVLKALAKKPEERFADAEELVRALTLLRDEAEPVGAGVLAAILGPPIEERITPFPTRPGSTQDRLDREFLLTQPPMPQLSPIEPLLPIAPASTAPIALAADAATVALTRPLAPAPAPPPPDPPAPAPLAPPTPLSPRSDPSVLDMTWVTAPVRKADPVLLRPVDSAAPVAPPPVEKAEQPVQGSRSRAALGWGLGLAAVLLLAAAGGFWWTRASSRAEPAAAPPPPIVEVAPTAAQASPPAEPPPDPVPPETEELKVAAAPLVPAPADSGKRERVKRVATEDRRIAAADLQPMQPGALILRGMPNVEPPIPLDIPAYTYPAAARGSGRKANVRVRILVDENGKVLEAVARDPEGSVFGFDEAALSAAYRVVFQAPTRDGIPGKMWTELIFEFAE